MATSSETNRANLSALSRFRYHATALHLVLRARELHEWAVKAGFRPDQPRIPRGHRFGGRWTPGGEGTRRDEPDARIIRVGADIDLLDDDDGDDFNIDEDERIFRTIPIVRPDGLSERYQIARSLVTAIGARFIVKPAMQQPKPSTILERVKVPAWLREYYPHMNAYLAPPKSLIRLQQDAQNPPWPGYNDHHRVERTPALRDGFPRSMVDGPDNIVRISTFRHWEVTSAFMRRSDELAGLSVREYLTGKSWEERQNVGLEILRRAGVLK